MRSGKLLMLGLGMWAAGTLVQATTEELTETGFRASNPGCVSQLSFDAPDANQVWVTGEFSSWALTPDEGAVPLQRNEQGIWTTTVAFPAVENQYKFIVNGDQWRVDPENPFQIEDGYGSTNSVVICAREPLTGARCHDPEAFDWRDTVMYFAMVDRFFDGDQATVEGVGASRVGKASAQYEGGDLLGLEQKLPYLDNLGVSALWMTAPFENRNDRGPAVDPSRDPHMYSAYHGYWPSPDYIDYSNPDQPQPRPQVESRIGDEQQLRSLIDQAHGLEAANGHGMRVMFDYVMNHVDIASGLYKQKPGWFATDKGRFRLCEPDNLWNHPYWGTRCSFTDYLPAFDLSNPDARRWSVADALWWAEEYNVDGYRLDAIKHVPMEWLYELRRQLNESDRLESDSQFYLVGETYDYSNRDVLRRYIDPATKLDGQFDFPLRLKLCEAFFRPSGNLGRLAQWMAGNDGYYDSGEPALMVNWIGNHDIPRAIHFASGQITNCYQGSSPANGWHSDRFRRVEDRVAYERLAQTFAVLMTQSGIPLIYYGDEIGLPGGGDPDNRRPMIWDDNQLNEHQKALRQEVGKLARLRGEKKVLGRGRTQNYFADKDRWVYRRGGCESNGLADDEVVVAFNRSNFGRVVPLPSGVYRDLLNGGRVYGGQHYLDARDYVLLERLSSAQ